MCIQFTSSQVCIKCDELQVVDAFRLFNGGSRLRACRACVRKGATLRQQFRRREAVGVDHAVFLPDGSPQPSILTLHAFTLNQVLWLFCVDVSIDPFNASPCACSAACVIHQHTELLFALRVSDTFSFLTCNSSIHIIPCSPQLH